MSKMKSRDVMSEMIELATERFGHFWKENEQFKDILFNYCDNLDILADEFGGFGFNIEIDEILMTIEYILEFSETAIDIYGNKHILFELLKRAERFETFASEDGNLCIKFVFPSIWERA